MQTKYTSTMKFFKQLSYKSTGYAGQFDDWQDERDAIRYREAEKQIREQRALNLYLDGE